MARNSPPSTKRSMRRAALSLAPLTAATLLSAGACVNPVDFGDTGAGGALLNTGGVQAGGLANAGGSGGTASGGRVGAGGNISPGGGAPALGGGAPIGGSQSDGGGSPAGGALNVGGTGGMASGGMGSGGAPCIEVQPPEDPEWPGATCDNWVNEANACGEDWFKNYCDISCGRCVPEGGTGGAPGVDCSMEGLPNVNGGDGFATRYWDCCQPHCAQFDGHRCSQDGTSRTGDSNSACNGGGSFACYDEAPYAVNDCLAYGHIAKANPNCGQCYRIQFTGTGHHNANDPGSKLIKGKQMIVKVTNTGSDVAGNQFDLMIPGGGVGQFNACSRQWGTSDLGAQYGGFLTNCTGSHASKKDCVRQNCMKIPAGKAREGCLWFVDWFEVADNPNFTSEPTNCPF